MGHSTDGHAVNFVRTLAVLRVIHHVIYGGQILGTAVASATTKYHKSCRLRITGKPRLVNQVRQWLRSCR